MKVTTASPSHECSLWKHVRYRGRADDILHLTLINPAENGFKKASNKDNAKGRYDGKQDESPMKEIKQIIS